jgi:acetyl esterase
MGAGPGSRLEAAAVSLLARLPPPVQRLLAGGRPVRLDGQELDPGVQLALRLLQWKGHRGLDTLTPAEARADILRDARTFAGTPPVLARVEERAIPGPAGSLPGRLYVPLRRSGPGLVIYYHGGGWVVGDLDSHDPSCRFLAANARLPVLAVAYRLAPEHRFPAAVDDALASFRWAAHQAADLAIDPRRIAVAGDSAGGNLAAVVARLAARDEVPPAAQLLVYPVTDLSRKHPSYALFRDGFFLSEREMDWYRDHYLPEPAAAADPRASPLQATDLRGLPPALVLTAGFDVLRDEGEAYAHRLEAAGVRVMLRRHGGLVHGFANATAVNRAAARAMEEAARWLCATVTAS